MFDIKDTFCTAGADCCEDVIGFGKDYLFAIDGATGLTGKLVMSDRSDAKWFAESVAADLRRCLDAGDSRSTAEILTESVDRLRCRYESRALELHEELPPDTPSAGFAMFREIGDEIEFFGLGDCVGAAELADGSVVSYCDDVLPVLDANAIDEMDRVHQEKGITVFEARKYCDAHILANRVLKNRPGGYWILDLGGEGIPNATCVRLKKSEVRTVSAFTDGFSEMVEPFEIYRTVEDLHRDMMRLPLDEMAEKLFAMQDSDPDGNAYPRFKLRDDTAGLCAFVR